jgi:multicomponent Na+:H+ antiporter subunit F
MSWAEHKAVREFLLFSALFVLATVAAGLLRLLYGPGNADRMMSAQLLGTGGMAVLLLLSAAEGMRSAIDVALTLAVLAAFASIAFVKAATDRDDTTPEDEA